ncbi:MAG: glucan biosynthesis protein, partial [Povalibacter sp.]
MYRAVTVLLVLAALSIAVAATRQEPGAKSPDRYNFTADTVPQLARRLSGESRSAPRIDAASPLRQLSYDQYRDIRTNPDASIWRNDQVPMRIELLPAGF